MQFRKLKIFIVMNEHSQVCSCKMHRFLSIRVRIPGFFMGGVSLKACGKMLFQWASQCTGNYAQARLAGGDS